MAAEDILGDLIINVGVDASGVGPGMDDATGKVRKGATDMSADLEGLGESATASGKALNDAWSQMGGGAEEAGQTIQQSLTQAATAMSQAGMALSEFVTIPLAGLGAAATAAGADFLQAMDLMEQKTGAVGEQLAGLQGTFATVFSSLPTNVKDATDVISQLTDRLGLSGPALEAMSEQMLNLARMTGSQAGPMVQQLTAEFNQWGISSDQVSGKLDLLFAIVQKSGTSLSTITTNLRTFAPAFQEMGFSFDQAAALIGQLDKEGVNVTRTLTALNLALRTLAKAGIEDPGAGLKLVIQDIKDAGSAGEANAIGIKVFGRSAVDLVAAIRTGKLDIDAFVASLQNSGGAINSTAAQTLTLGQRFTEFKNQVETALAPLGDVLVRILSNLMQQMQPLIAVLAELAKGFTSLDPTTQAFIIAMAATAAASGPILLAFGAITRGLAGLVTLFEGGGLALGGLAGSMGAVGTLMVSTVVPAIAAIAAAFAAWSVVSDAKSILTDLAGALGLFGGEAKESQGIVTGLGTQFDSLLTPMGLLRAGVEALSSVWTEFKAELKQSFDWQVLLGPGIEGFHQLSLMIHDVLGTSDSTGFGAQLSKGLQTATTSSTAFQTAWQNSVKAVKDGTNEYGLAGQKVTQSTGDMRAALDQLYNGAQKAISAVKAIPFKDLAPPELVTQIQAITNEHQKAIAAVVKINEQIDRERGELGPLAAGLSNAQVATLSASQAFDQLVTATDAAANEFLLIDEDMNQAADTIGATKEPVDELQDAFNALGLNSTADLKDLAEAARTAYETIAASSVEGSRQVNEAWVKMTEAAINYRLAMGDDVSEQEADLKAMKDQLDGADSPKSGWDTLYNRVLSNKAILQDLGRAGQQVFRDLSTGIADVILDHRKFSDVLKQIEKDILRTFIEVGLKAVLRFALEGLAKVLAGFGGISGALGGIAAKIGGVFGGSGGGGGFKIPGLPGFGGGSDTVDEMGGKWGGGWDPNGGSSGGGSSMGGFGGGGGTLGTVLGFAGLGVSIASGIVSGIQGARSNNLLGEIEKSTRGALAQLIVMQETSFNKYLPSLPDINGAVQKAQNFLSQIHADLNDWVRRDLDGIAQAIAKGVAAVASTAGGITYAPTPGSMASMLPAGAMVAGASYSLNNFTITDPDVVRNANALINSLKRAGLKI